MIDPFDNDHQSMQIGDLVIENQTDKIIIYGDIDLTFDKNGHKQAVLLHELSGRILQAFEAQAPMGLTSSSANNDTDDEIDNPFL